MENKIEKRKKNELINIIEHLIEVINIMRKERDEYLLQQNEREAKDWLNYLREHDEKEELLSLKKEVVERLIYKFDIIVRDSELDDERVFLMKEFIKKSQAYLK